MVAERSEVEKHLGRYSGRGDAGGHGGSLWDVGRLQLAIPADPLPERPDAFGGLRDAVGLLEY